MLIKFEYKKRLNMRLAVFRITLGKKKGVCFLEFQGTAQCKTKPEWNEAKVTEQVMGFGVSVG